MKILVIFISRMVNFTFNFITLKRKRVYYSNMPIINGRLKLHGNGDIRIGNGIKINSSESSNPIGGMEHTLIEVREGAILEIGDFTGISNSAIVCRERITIGKNVMIGGSVKLYDSDFHSLDWRKRLDSKTDRAISSPISIEDNVFIGAHSIILKGVTIGARSIIGAGSVITKEIPPGQIWAGNPARFLKNIDGEMSEMT